MKFEINKRIAQIRKKKGITQKFLAEKLGLNETTYSQMEREGIMKGYIIADIAKILGVTTDQILYGDIIDPNDFFVDSKKKELYQPAFPENEFFSDTIILAKQEENLIKIMRSLSKEDRAEILALVQEKSKNNKNN